MAKKQDTLTVNINVDQTILADFQEMVEEMKDACRQSREDCTDEHTLDSEIEHYMKLALTQWSIQKIIKRYV